MNLNTAYRIARGIINQKKPKRLLQRENAVRRLYREVLYLRNKIEKENYYRRWSVGQEEHLKECVKLLAEKEHEISALKYRLKIWINKYDARDKFVAGKKQNNTNHI